jgi:thiol-disulfide isomerase/thioredoxin
MISKVFAFIKPFLGVALVLGVLQFTGVLSRVNSVAQSAVMTTGVLNAGIPARDGTEENFDYNFAVKDLKGNRVPIDQFKGKVIFLNLWATWCGPCRAEMPTIQKLYDNVAKDNLVFVMLSLDRDQDKAKIVDYIGHKAFTFPVYQPSGYLTQQLDIPSIPTTFIVSKDGKIIAREVGTTNFGTAKFQKFLEAEAAR